MAHAPGDPIRVEVTKWGDRPHWRFEGVWLGRDDHGQWLGFPLGTHHARPGAAFDSVVDTVTLVPDEGHWLATFHPPGTWCEVYVDVSTPAAWDGDVLRTIDLDLDVVRMSATVPDDSRPLGLTAGPGDIFIDDEDEFLEHQAAFGYPADVIDTARASADALKVAVEEGRAPYDGAHLPWLKELDRLTS